MTPDSRQSIHPRKRHVTHGETNNIVGAAAAAEGLEVGAYPSTDITNDPKRRPAGNGCPQAHQSNWRKTSQGSILHTPSSPPPSGGDDDEEGGNVFGDAEAAVVVGASTGTSEAKAARVLKPGQDGNAQVRLLSRHRGSAMDGGVCVYEGA